MIQVMLGDRQRLEQHVEDWKIIAEQCEEKKLELDQVVRKISHCVKDVELEVQSNLFIRIPFHKDTSLLRMYLRVPYFYGEE
jgi:hypothetical protein